MADRYDVEAIRAAHPITETVRDAGVALRPTGRRLSGRCPFHEDRDPSFVVYPDTASYFCFGCNAGGDVIDFVGRLRGTGFKETAAWLSSGVMPLPSNVVRFPPARTVRPLAPDEAAVVEAAVEHYERSLGTYPDVRSYLARRGIGLDTARELRLGYAAGGLARHLRDRGHRLDAAQQIGLLADDREAFNGRIVIPELDAGGSARWLTGRTLCGRDPRYLNLRAASPLLGLARARLVGSEAVVVTEGPFDWLTACSWAIPAVALLGTHVSQPAVQALRLFARCYVALDADDPGRRAAAALAADLGPRAAPVTLPRGVHDLNELGQRRDGRAVFLRSLRESRTRMEESWPMPTDRDRHDRAA